MRLSVPSQCVILGRRTQEMESHRPRDESLDFTGRIGGVVHQHPLPVESAQPVGAATYRSVSWMLGFAEKLSLMLCFVFGGAIIGFCLFNVRMMNFTTMRQLTVPGEWYWFGRKLYHVSYSMHIYLSIIGGLLLVLQFLPVIRKRTMILHRINGGVVFLCLIPANIAGMITATRAFGGEINSQSAYYLLGTSVVICYSIGLISSKHTRTHRKWMLRGSIIFGVPITARLFGLCAREIVTRLETYYAIFRCGELLSVAPQTAPLSSLYPSCFLNGTVAESVYVAVHANVKDGIVGLSAATRATTGMSLWLAMLAHVMGVELYLKVTEEANFERVGYILQPKALETENDYDFIIRA